MWNDVATARWTACAALRLGFIAAESSRAEELTDVKMLLHFGGSEYAERVLEAILREGNFLRHIKRPQDRLRVATQTGLETLRQFEATVYATPEQSLYLWARFPGVTDTRLLTIRMLARGVVLGTGCVLPLEHRADFALDALECGVPERPIVHQQPAPGVGSGVQSGGVATAHRLVHTAGVGDLGRVLTPNPTATVSAPPRNPCPSATAP